MKNLTKTPSFRILLLLVVFSCPSCKKYLQEEVYSQQFPGNFYTNPGEAQGAILGIMDSYTGTIAQNMITVADFMTDNVVIEASQNLADDKQFQFAQKNVKSTNGMLLQVYQSIYKSIYNANAMIYFMQKIQWEASVDKQRQQYIAEAYTLRAMGYYYLVRMFGNVPLIAKIEDNTPEAPKRIGRSDIPAVYAQIISDLKIAKTLYTQEGARINGYPSKIMARLLLSSVYLTMSGEPLNLGATYYPLAVAESDTLINAKAAGIVVPALPEPDKLFSVAYENTGEIIFSAQNNDVGTGNFWASAASSFGALSFDLLNEFDTSGPIDLTNPARDIRGVDPNTAAYDQTKFTKQTDFIDGRFYPTFWPYADKWDAVTKKMAAFRDALLFAKDPSRYSLNTTVSGVKYNTNKTVFPGKYRSDYQYKAGDNAAYPHNDKKANVILWRWAEAYLIYAEADNELNGPRAAAIAAVNKIRKRAGLTDLPAAQIATKDAFRTAIRKEWRLEFAFETKHLYNMRRWGTAIDKVNSFAAEFNKFNPKITQMNMLSKDKNEVYPIPFSEIEAAGFTQNPGY